MKDGKCTAKINEDISLTFLPILIIPATLCWHEVYSLINDNGLGQAVNGLK